jgi:MFS transporter, AAHS family, 3-hydroxyphenylpropionic acid transporter
MVKMPREHSIGVTRIDEREDRFIVIRVVVICLLIALFEGMDIQSMGVAAPRLAPSLGLGPSTMGALMSASTLGLLFGALIGGRASDRIGRRRVLMFSVMMLALFSLATAVANGFTEMLLSRLAVGLGLGGVFPNLIAMTSDTAPGRWRVTALGAVYCGLPLGGMLAAAVAKIPTPVDWRLVFFVGAAGSTFTLPLLLMLLPRDQPLAVALVAPRHQRLLDQGASVTFRLWVSYFFTLFAVYLLLNWLPSLMTARGLSHLQAENSVILLNLGAVVGSLILGRLADQARSALVLIVTYSGMLVAILGLAVATDGALQSAVFLAGFFVIGGQLILYAIAPTIYPAPIRGTGVGAAVAVGRAGSVAGPLTAGFILAAGWGAGAVSMIALPGLLAALLAIFTIAKKPESART